MIFYTSGSTAYWLAVAAIFGRRKFIGWEPFPIFNRFYSIYAVN
jgi:hypothetical protein